MLYNEKKPVGIVAYGTKIPKGTITGEEIARSQGKEKQKIYQSLGVFSKTKPNVDEDTITLATAASWQAIQRLSVLCGEKENVKAGIGALFIGSESHPYAVKPSGTIVAQALGFASDSLEMNVFANTNADTIIASGGAASGHNQKKVLDRVIKPLALADLQFACKAGTQALQIASLYVQSGFCKYALGIGVDTAQSQPGDVLEYTAGAGAAAFVLGAEFQIGAEGKKSGMSHKIAKGGVKNQLLAKLLATTCVATDTPDFWRRPHQEYPEHAGRFTAEPGYFSHITMATQRILQETGLHPSDFEYCVFHTPNAKFPMQIAQKLGFSQKQIEASLLVKSIGNTYAGASMLGLAATLDIAKAGKKILVVSYGSGSGSDAFVFETTEWLVTAREKWGR